MTDGSGNPVNIFMIIVETRKCIISNSVRGCKENVYLDKRRYLRNPINQSVKRSRAKRQEKDINLREDKKQPKKHVKASV